MLIKAIGWFTLGGKKKKIGSAMFHKKLSLGLTTNLGKLCHLFEPQFHKKKNGDKTLHLPLRTCIKQEVK